MNQNKWILFIAALLAVAAARADVETTDKILVSELQVEPGSSSVYNFTVSLDGSDTYYTAFEIDLTLPDGLSVATTSKGDLRVSMVKPSLYPYEIEEQENEDGDIEEVKTYTHQLSKAMTGPNALKVIVLSLENELFTKTSGNLFKVYVQASPYLKPGDVEIGVKALLVTPDEVKYYPEEYTSTSVQASATSTLSLKVSADNKFGTCILPFSYDLPADGSLQAYTCNDYTNDAILLAKAERMEAYQPYILYSQEGFSGTLSGTVDAGAYPEGGMTKQGLLVGTLVQTELTATTSYVMQNQGNGVMFYQVGETPFVVPAGKCYVVLPDGASARNIRIAGEETGIIETETGERETENKEIYDLSGRLVQELQKGIYIVNGNKVAKQ